MKSGLFLLLTVFCFRVYSQQTVINDANAQVRNVSAFSSIKVSGGIDVYLSHGDNYSIAVSAATPEYVNSISTDVKDGVLYVSGGDRNRRNADDKKLRIYISFKELESIDISGATAVYIDGTVTSNTMLMKLSGASILKGSLKITNLSIELSGASVVKVDGNVQNLKIDASDASDIKNYGLQVENCIAKLSGASDIRLTVNVSVSVSASGASTFFYQGNPDKKEIEKSGASSVQQKSN